MSEEVIKRWVDIISDDYMHWTDEQKTYINKISKAVDWEIWKDDIGVLGWLTVMDFDCKLKTNVLLFYCKPEYRGAEIIPMIKRMEEIAKTEGAEKLIVGEAMSAFKEDKFNQIFPRLGYHNSGYVKDL